VIHDHVLSELSIELRSGKAAELVKHCLLLSVWLAGDGDTQRFSKALCLIEIGAVIGNEPFAKLLHGIRSPLLFGKLADLNFGQIALDGVRQKRGIRSRVAC
jgi:hypothetical protein